MKRLVFALVLVVASTVIPALPAGGGWYAWEPSPCRADMEWMATSAGVWYWQYGFSESQGAHLVTNGHYLDSYRNQGYECGALGAPLTNRTCQAGFCHQRFEGGVIAG